MGEVIRRGAAAEDVFADVRTTLTRASAKGGDWKTTAEARLNPILTLAAAVKTRRDTAAAAATVAQAALDTQDDAADALLGRVSDDVWNLVGRPAQDPFLDLLFPGGIAYYADGAISDQPEKMDLLAELLESNIHPRIEAPRAAALATEVRQASAALREKVEAARPLVARVALADKMNVAIARAGQIALAGLKRVWKAEGKTEVQIHEVIPDRPAPRKAAGGGGGPVAPGGGGGGGPVTPA